MVLASVKAPLLVAEEFGFHQRLRNGRAVDGDERLFLAAALVVDRLGDEVFAGAALALHQNGGGFAGGNFADETHQFRHLLRDADHVVIAGAAAHFAAQRLTSERSRVVSSAFLTATASSSKSSGLPTKS